jgi:hypothetical protein
MTGPPVVVPAPVLVGSSPPVLVGGAPVVPVPPPVDVLPGVPELSRSIPLSS